MEAISAAASVAGLLSVAGHVLNGLVKLNAFIQDLKEADARAQRLTAEANLLSQTITDFKSLLKTLDEKAIDENRPFWVQHFAIFCSRLEDCVRDLNDWTDSCRLGDGSGSKRRKIIDGISNKKGREMSEMESKLARHRSQVVLDMNTINGWISLGGLEKIAAVHEAVEKLTKANLQMNQTNMDCSTTALEESTREHHHLEDIIISNSQAHSRQLISEHYETRSQLSRLSDSVSSIASSLQQLITPPLSQARRHRSGSQAMRPLDPKAGFELSGIEGNKKRRFSALETALDRQEPKIDLASKPVGWTCGQAIGIDDYFVERQEDWTSQRMRCGLCNQTFAYAESLERSKHVVEFHNFAGCDQSVCYQRGSSFGSHLEKCHAANLQAFSANHSYLKAAFYRQQPKLEDERIESLYGKPEHLERSTAPLILENQLRSLLIDFVDANQENSDGLITPRDLQQHLKVLSDTVFSADSPLELATLLYRAAILTEELSVSFDRMFRSRWVPTLEIMLQQVSSTHKEESRQSEKNPFFADSWFLWFDPDQEAINHPYKCCTECKNGTRYSDPNTAFKHLSEHHLGMECNITFERQRPTSEISSLFKKLNAGKSLRDRVDLWMLNILHQSDHLLTILRRGTFFGSSLVDETTQAARHDIACSQLWRREWTQDLLRAFERKGLEAIDDGVYPIQSDGAVYSRDDGIFSESVDTVDDDEEISDLPMRFHGMPSVAFASD